MYNSKSCCGQYIWPQRYRDQVLLFDGMSDTEFFFHMPEVHFGRSHKLIYPNIDFSFKIGEKVISVLGSKLKIIEVNKDYIILQKINNKYSPGEWKYSTSHWWSPHENKDGRQFDKYISAIELQTITDVELNEKLKNIVPVYDYRTFRVLDTINENKK
jgi:hypothetical protein